MGKTTLPQLQIITNGNMNGALTSDVVQLALYDNLGIQSNYTGNCSGSIAIQESIDYQQDSQGNVLNAGNWITVVSMTVPTATSPILVDLNQQSAPYLQVVWTPTGGTGTLNVFANGKRLS